jgi:fumarate hydratase subunit beta
MDAYSPRLISLGLKGMIGKGKRSQAVRDAIKQYRAVYFGATGGAGALLSKSVTSAEIIAYEDLGPEAVVRLGVVDMPLFVINDIYGNDLYESGTAQYRR